MNFLVNIAIGALVGFGGATLSTGPGRNLIYIPIGILGALIGNLLFSGSLGTSNAIGVTVISAVAVVVAVLGIRNQRASPGRRKR